MNKIRAFIAFVLVVTAEQSGAVPPLMQYQGQLTDSAGAAIDSTLPMLFQFYDSSIAGTILWSETQSAVSIVDGLFAVKLGDVTPIPDSVFNSAAVFLGVTVGENSELVPRVQISSMGYAFRVNAVDGAAGGNISGPISLNGDLLINGRTEFDGVAIGNDSLIARAGAVIDGPFSVSGAIALENSAATTYIYSNAGHSEGVFLSPGASCWQAIDTSDHCGAGPAITSVNGLSGGTIASDVTISGKLNIGGANNINSGIQALVSGSNNRARGDYSTIGGGGGASINDSNTTSGQNATIAGGRRNLASGMDSFVGGGQRGRAVGVASAVLGGAEVKARGDYSVACGGGGPSQADSNYALSQYSFVGGGNRNGVGTSGSPLVATYGVVTGGRGNIVSDTASTIVGGIDNSISGDTAFVGGGYSNSASADQSVICGGNDNAITSGGDFAFIGGGNGNSSNGSHSVCVGGQGNTAGGSWAVNSGGFQNIASGAYATIPGGWGNSASGRYAIACGRFGTASHAGSFVWSDTTGSFSSQGENTFAVRATNGVYMFTSAAAGARLPSGSSTWTTISDSTAKNNIRAVSTEKMLDAVTRLPIKQWSYKTQNPTIEHIGPMAQDFWNIFGLGDDSLTISTIDPAGIALAAIQELAKQNELLRGEVRQLRSDVQVLKQERNAAMVRDQHGR